MDITLKNGNTVKKGSGCALWINGDASPWTLIDATPSGHTLTLQAATVVSVESGQTFAEGAKRATFAPNPNGRIRTVTWSPKYKRYAPKGEHSYYSVSFGGYATAYNPHV